MLERVSIMEHAGPSRMDTHCSPVLAPCTESLPDEIARLGRRMRHPRGRTIVNEGDPVERVFRVVSGVVRTTKLLADGRRQVLDFISADDDVLLGDGDTHAASIEAVTDVELVSYPRARFEVLVLATPDATRWLVAALRGALQRGARRLEILGRKAAEERVAMFLLDRVGPNRRSMPIVWIPMSRLDIGDFLGLRIETVSREFSRLKANGCIVEKSRSQVAIADCARVSRRSLNRYERRTAPKEVNRRRR